MKGDFISLCYVNFAGMISYFVFLSLPVLMISNKLFPLRRKLLIRLALLIAKDITFSD